MFFKLICNGQRNSTKSKYAQLNFFQILFLIQLNKIQKCVAISVVDEKSFFQICGVRPY